MQGPVPLGKPAKLVHDVLPELDLFLEVLRDHMRPAPTGWTNGRRMCKACKNGAAQVFLRIPVVKKVKQMQLYVTIAVMEILQESYTT